MSRVPLDAYYTPLPLARAIVARLPVKNHACLEPSAGGGAFVRAMLDAGAAGVTAVDIDPGAPALYMPGATMCVEEDFLTWKTTGMFSWAIGNPPFKFAEAHIRKARSVARNVAFLLRTDFLASEKRFPLFRAHPVKRLMVLAQRPSFIRGKRARTDRYDYAVFCWGEAFEPGIEWISWR